MVGCKIFYTHSFQVLYWNMQQNTLHNTRIHTSSSFSLWEVMNLSWVNMKATDSSKLYYKTNTFLCTYYCEVIKVCFPVVYGGISNYSPPMWPQRTYLLKLKWACHENSITITHDKNNGRAKCVTRVKHVTIKIQYGFFLVPQHSITDFIFWEYAAHYVCIFTGTVLVQSLIAISNLI